MSNIGMMDGAFFVGRKEIVDWLNDTLDLNLSKVEQTCNGAIAVQLLDIMYPGKIPMSKLNWAAKHDHEYVGNYKVLQNCFTKLKIDRHVDVDRLIKGKYQDNLEFMQWFKRFFELSVSEKPTDYDANAQRAKGKGGSSYNLAKSGKGGVSGVAKVTAAAGSKSTKPSTTAASSKKTSTTTSSTATTTTRSTGANKKTAPANNSVALQQQVGSLTALSAELQVELSGIEKERDFYFEKLRDIEVMLQDLEDNGKGNDLTAAIFKILYATAEGFEAVEDNNTETEQIEDNSQQKDSTVEPEEEAQEEAF